VYAFVEVEDISLNKNGDLLQERLYAVHRQVSDFKSTLEYYFCYLKMTAMVDGDNIEQQINYASLMEALKWPNCDKSNTNTSNYA